MRKPHRFRTVHLSNIHIRQASFFAILGCAFIIVLIGFITTIHAKRGLLSDRDQLAAPIISTHTLQAAMGEVIPYLHDTQHQNHWYRLIFEAATNINLKDPRTFLGNELPMFSLFDTEITAASEDVDYSSIPIESAPPPDLEKEITKGLGVDQDDIPYVSGQKTKKIFLYNTHFSESFLPELKKNDPNQTDDLHTNVVKISKHMAQTFEQHGIGAIVNKKPPKGWSRKHAYQYSRRDVVAAMKTNNDLQYFIDIHRDSHRRHQTTITMGNKTYARIAFVVGSGSKHYEANRKLSEEMCTKINKKYKQGKQGLCRAVFIKNPTKNINGEYNQSLSPHSLLLEVGGIDNTFAEAFRSIDILAKLIIERIKNQTYTQQ